MKSRNGYTVYPLTVAQKFHTYYMEFCPKKEVLNIGTSLTLDMEIDFEELRNAIYKACERAECMRVHFVKDEDGTWYQYVVERYDKEIEFVDFSDVSMEDAAKTMEKWTRIPFAREDSYMNRIVMIKTSDGYSGIYLLADHMIMDAQSLIVFLRDVIELYCSAKYEGMLYPKEMASYIEQVKKDLAYEAGSKAKQRDEDYFHKLIEESEPIFNGLDGSRLLEEQRKKEQDMAIRAAVDVADSVEARIDTFHLEEERSRRLVQFCEDKHISLTCLLIMAIRTYLQMKNGNEDVSINTAVARRATLMEKKSGGTRVHSYPFRTIISESKTFMEGVCVIRDLQNEMFRHAGFDPVAYYAYRRMIYRMPKGSGYEPLALTYQPMSLHENRNEGAANIKYKTVRYSTGVATHALYLTVAHSSEDGGLDFNFEYQIKAFSYDDIEYFYRYLCRIMFNGIENPDLTIGEIIKLA